MEYLVTMTTRVPDGFSDSTVAAMRAREAAHTAELARAGRVVRLWRPPQRSDEWSGRLPGDPLAAHTSDPATAATDESGTS